MSPYALPALDYATAAAEALLASLALAADDAAEEL